MNDFPILVPLLALLRSRKFMLALVALLVDFLIAYAPILEPARTELMTVVTLLASVVIGGIAYEDGQLKRNSDFED